MPLREWNECGQKRMKANVSTWIWRRIQSMCLDNSDDCLVVSCYMERFAMTILFRTSQRYWVLTWSLLSLIIRDRMRPAAQLAKETKERRERIRRDAYQCFLPSLLARMFCVLPPLREDWERVMAWLKGGNEIGHFRVPKTLTLSKWG